MFSVLPIAMAFLTASLLKIFKKKSTLEAAHLAGTFAVASCAIALLLQPLSATQTGFWLGDALSRYFVAIITCVYVVASIFSIRYLLQEYAQGKLLFKKLQSYYFWFHIFVGTMYLTVLINNLGLMWVAVELTTLASALLVGFYNTKSSLEAAWKYIFLCSVGIGLALFGIILAFYATEHLFGSSGSALNWVMLKDNARLLNPQILKLAFVFIMVGFGTKVGLAPMHTWLPDAHSQAPAPISGMLSGVLLSCALYGILRFQTLVNLTLGNSHFTSHILIAFGLFSMFLSLPFLLVQHDVKRLLAYSSIEHMGFITLAFGIGGKLAIFGGLLHVLFHALAKSGLFFAVGDITNHWHTKKIPRITGVAEVFPLEGWAAFIAVFALAGSPPFGLFRSELLVLSAAVNKGSWYIAALMLAALVTAFVGLVYHFGRMIAGRAKATAKRSGFLQPFFIVLPLLLLFIFGLWLPPFIEKAVTAATTVVLGGMI